MDTPLLDQENKGIEAATNVLSRLFRLLLADLKITPIVWDKMMKQYLDNPVNRISRNSRVRSWTRGNLNRVLLSRSAMTWRNFEQGLRFLSPVEATFSIRLTWKNGKVSEHQIAVQLEPPQTGLTDTMNFDSE